MERVKGATQADQAAHRLYDARFRRRKIPASCRICGTILGYEYHEERLYSMTCESCRTVTLVKADTLMEAAMAVGEIMPTLPEMGA